MISNITYFTLRTCLGSVRCVNVFWFNRIQNTVSAQALFHILSSLYYSIRKLSMHILVKSIRYILWVIRLVISIKKIFISRESAFHINIRLWRNTNSLIQICEWEISFLKWKRIWYFNQYWTIDSREQKLMFRYHRFSHSRDFMGRGLFWKVKIRYQICGARKFSAPPKDPIQAVFKERRVWKVQVRTYARYLSFRLGTRISTYSWEWGYWVPQTNFMWKIDCFTK